MSRKKKLTDKQQRFVKEYLVDLNATQAAIRAGYKEKRAYQIGHENLRKPEIEVAVQDEMNKRSERTEVTQDFVLNGIVENIKRCEQAGPVLDRKGNQIYVNTPDGKVAPAYTYDAKNALKGYDLLGKNLGLWTEKREYTGKNGGPIETEQKVTVEFIGPDDN